MLFILYALSLSAVFFFNGPRSQNKPSASPSQKSYKRLLVVGATGGTGQQIISQALERGFTVTALVRNASKLNVKHPQLKVIQGDILDYSAVESAARGQDAVLCALGHKKFFFPTRILSQGTRNLLQAMETEGVKRLVCETSLGIGHSAGRMGLYYTLFVVPVILPFYFWDKMRQEKLIAASNINWVIVRPAVLTNKKMRKTYRHGSVVGNFVWTANISRADVADFMLNQVTDETYLGTAVGICR